MAKDGSTEGRLHRVDVVASQQQLSVRSISRNAALSVPEVKRMLDPRVNLTISELRKLQQCLGEIPLSDLVVKPALNPATDHGPTVRRALLVKLKKTAGSLFEELSAKGDPQRVKEYALRFIDLLLQFAPELESQLEKADEFETEEADEDFLEDIEERLGHGANEEDSEEDESYFEEA